MSATGGHGGRPSKLIDVTPLVSGEMWVWPGDEPYRMQWRERLESGNTTNLSAISMSPHLGAHVDAPLHFLAGGADVAALDLTPFLGPAVVVDASSALGNDGAIPADVLAGFDLAAAERLLLRTGTRAPRSAVGRSTQAGSPVHLARETAEQIAGSGLVLLGIDAPSVDAHDARDLPNHRQLAQAGVAVLVGLDLTAAPPGRYELCALPLRLAGAEASPVRAVLRPLGPLAPP